MEWRWRRESARRIFDQAVSWIAQIQQGQAEDERMLAWLRRSPQHVEAFFAAWQAWEELREVSPERRERIERLATEISASSHNVAWLGQLFEAQIRTGTPRLSHWRLGLIGLVLALFAGVLLWRYGWPGGAYEIQNKGISVTLLPDGSRIHLNANSRVVVRFGKHSREVELTRGEVKFDVAHDVTRPFRVRVYGASVQAVGTRFDVSRDDHGSCVLVEEGQVTVTAPESGSPAERLRVTELERVTIRSHAGRALLQRDRVSPEQLRNLLAWSGWLTLDGKTFGEIIEEFNRSGRFHLVVDDPEMPHVHLGGQFNVYDGSSFLAALTRLGFQASEPDASGAIHLSRASARPQPSNPSTVLQDR